MSKFAYVIEYAELTPRKFLAFLGVRNKIFATKIEERTQLFHDTVSPPRYKDIDSEEKHRGGHEVGLGGSGSTKLSAPKQGVAAWGNKTHARS